MYQLTSGDRVTIEEYGTLLSHDLGTIAKLDQKTRDLIEITDSEISGRGYRTLEDIAEGEWVMSAFGILIGHQTEQHSIQQGMEVHIEPFEYGGKYLNHSCEGNLVVHSDNRGITGYYARRQIQHGEELNYHFALTEFIWSDIASETDIECNCGASKCEGVINAFDMLSSTQQKALAEKNIVSKYLIDWFEKQQRPITASE